MLQRIWARLFSQPEKPTLLDVFQLYFSLTPLTYQTCAEHKKGKQQGESCKECALRWKRSS